MTIIEAINGIDSLKPNAYSQLDKIAWLSTLDGIVKRQILDTHLLGDGEEESEFAGYDENTDLSTELLIKDPYDRECYLPWLESKIDYSNGEYVKYNNSVLKFRDAYSDYQNDYNRHHMPKETTIKYF